MRKIHTILHITALLLLPALASAQMWTGVMGTDWNTPGNWSPATVPNSPMAFVIIPVGPPQPVLGSSVNVGTILMLGLGTSLNLNGNTLTVHEYGGFTSATISNGTVATPMAGGALGFTGSTINNITFEKLGGGNILVDGNNTFNGNTLFDVKAAASGSCRLTNNFTFAGDVEFRNQSAVMDISVAEAGVANLFLGDVRLANGSSGGITFGVSGGLSLVAGSFLNAGITDGSIMLLYIAQIGAAANDLGTPDALVVGGDCSFVGNFSCSAQTSIALNGSVFNGNNSFSAPNIIQVTGCIIGGPTSTASTLHKTNTGSPADNFWSGNNKFGPCTITNSSDANLRLSASVRDTFRADAVFNNNGAALMEIASRDSCYFAGNVELNNFSPKGIRVGSTIVGGRATIKGKLLTTSYLTGALEVYRTDQLDSLGNDAFAPQSFLAKVSNFQGNIFCAATVSILLDSSSFHRTNVFSSPNFTEVQTSVFSDVPGHETVFKKLAGGGNNFWSGHNAFGKVDIVNESPELLYMAYGFGTPDKFIAEASFRQLDPAGNLYPCHNSDCLFNGDISTVGTSKSIEFGPTAMGRAVIGGDVAQVLRGDVFIPPVFRRILMATTGTLQLQVPITIFGQVVFTNGIILSDAVNFPTWQAAPIPTGMSDNSHVAGPVRRFSNTTSSFTFPVGKNNKYAPVTIVPGTGVFGTFQVEYFDNPFSSLNVDATLDHVSACEYWDINRLLGGGVVSVTMTWDDVRSCGITDLTTLRLAHWNGANWTNIGGAVMGVLPSGTITANGVMSFSPFTLASTNAANPLPIELLYFNARPNGEVVDLNWATASEKDNDYFTVERSRDGILFDPVLQVSGAGTSTQTLHYSDTDRRPLPGLSYYRLRQTDFNGDFSVSNVVAVQMPTDGKEFAVYPNPVQDHFYLDTGAELSGLRHRLINSMGQTIPTAPQIEAGRLRFSTQGLAAGLYFLEVLHGDAVQSFKVIVR
jgi:hypothetical protein